MVCDMMPALGDDDLAYPHVYDFVSVIQKQYNSANPYHNFRHAFDVTQMMYLILNKHNEHLRERTAFFGKNPNAINLEKYDLSEIEDYQRALQSANSVFTYSLAKSHTIVKKDLFSIFQLENPIIR